MDLGCYPLHWVDTIAESELRSVDAKAELTASGVDASMEIAVNFNNGVNASISCSMIASGAFSTGMTISGSEGHIEFSNPSSPHNGGALRLVRKSGEIKNHTVSKISTFQYQLESMINALENNTTILTEGATLVRQQSLIDDVYAAAGLTHLRRMV